jgi:hypothetical protein
MIIFNALVPRDRPSPSPACGYSCGPFWHGILSNAALDVARDTSPMKDEEEKEGQDRDS